MNRSISNIWLHPTVRNPELLADLELSTGLLAIPSNRTRGIILVRPEDALLREALASIGVSPPQIPPTTESQSPGA